LIKLKAHPFHTVPLKSQKLESSQKQGIYDYDIRIQRTYKLIRSELSESNQQLIEKYDKVMITESLAKATRHKNLQIVLNLSRYLNKDWTLATKEDIGNLVVRIMQEYSGDSGQETNTTYDHKKILKIFFRWLKLGSRSKEDVQDPPELKGIKLKKVKDKIVRENLVTEDDRTKLLLACKENLRDKAFIDCHSEAGTRPGEILSLKIKHVHSDNYGTIIKVDGKTGARTIRLIRSTPNLAAWMNAHPQRNNPEAPLWIELSKNKLGRQLTYFAAYQMIRRRCSQANLPKRVYLNLFRHSEATETAKYLTEAQMKKRHGWSQDSKMPGRYVHLVNADVG
jgi:integrase